MKMFKKAVTLSLGVVLMGSTATFAQSLDDAKKAIDAEQYQKATGMLKTLIASKAKDGDNYYYLGRVYLLNDNLDSARAVFTQGTTADAKNALNYVGLGQADFESGNAANAKTNFDKAISFGAKNYETHLAIGRAYISGDKPDFAAALPFLQKADELDSKDKDAETFIALGDFYALQRKNTDAYPQYLRALDVNGALKRPHVQIGKMYQDAFAFPEAETELKKVIESDANYGPAYRQMAENQMQWSRGVAKAEAETKRTEALANMKKYLDLTDKSFDSRLRYAQFLVYANDFATLEKEVASLNAPANDPREFVVLRMKGYSQIENKNYAEGLKTLDALFARKQDEARIIGSDYLYLGLAQKNTGNDSLALTNITKAVKLDSTKVDTLAGMGFKFYAAKNFTKAAEVYTTVVNSNSANPNLVTNLYYLGRANYFNYGADLTANRAPRRELLVAADSAFARVNKLAPDYEGAYLDRARVNKQLDNLDNKEALKGLPVPFYQQYVELVTVKKPEKAATAKAGLIESYNNLGAYAALTDVAKAKEYFGKTLALDAANATATENMKLLNTPAKKPAGK